MNISARNFSILLVLLWGAPVLAGTCPASVPGGITVCKYIDYVSGSDSNTGEDEANTWKNVPGMTGCASNCAAENPSAGHGYILKGGTIWPASAMPWNWNWSGNGTTTATYGCAGAGCIYIGVDPAWNQGTVNAVNIVRDLASCARATGNAVSFSGGGGSGAAASPVVIGGQAAFASGRNLVSYIKITNSGSGYTSAPVVNFSGPNCNVKLNADIQRAIIDGGSQSGTIWNGPDLIYSTGKFVIWDNLEIRNAAYNSPGGNFNVFAMSNASNSTLSNSYVHNSYPSGGHDSGYLVHNAWNTGLPSTDKVYGNYIANGEQVFPCPIGSPSTYCSLGSALDPGGEAAFNRVSFATWLMRGGTNFHDNEVWGASAGTLGEHTNTWFNIPDPNNGNIIWIYDNYTHDTDQGGAFFVTLNVANGNAATWYIFNNVTWNAEGGGTIWGIDTSQLTGNLSNKANVYFWNNTAVAANGGTGAFVNDPKGSVASSLNFNLSLFNNHIISDQTTNHWWTNSFSPNLLNGVPGSTANTPDSKNVIMTNSTAVSQGYCVGGTPCLPISLTNLFQPASSSSATVIFGSTNLANTNPGSSTPSLGQLSYDIVCNSRLVSGPPSWNAGAYVYTGKPSPPCSVTAVAQ